MAANSLTNDANFVQMVIQTRKRQEVPLSQTEAIEIEKYIFSKISTEHVYRVQFRGEYVFSKVDGAIIINTHKDSVYWLKSIIAHYEKKALSATNIKKCPQYTTKVRTVVSQNEETIDNLLVLLEAHNVRLQTYDWRIVDIVWNAGKFIVTLLIDDPGREMLEKNGFKLLLGFSTLTFEFLGRVKRSQTTGVIYDDDIQSQED